MGEGRQREKEGRERRRERGQQGGKKKGGMKKQGLGGKHPMLILLPWLFLILKRVIWPSTYCGDRIKSEVQARTKLRYYESK